MDRPSQEGAAGGGGLPHLLPPCRDPGRGLGQARRRRTVSFVFNGGPGASSAYLHVGGLSPRRVLFKPDGNMEPPPVRLVNNPESWIAFTDLVFVDPVGTGFSRIVEPEKKPDDKEKPDPSKTVGEKEFYALNRDLESLGEFIERFLSRHKLWDVPVAIVGESYGGFRTAKLARLLQERHGVGLSTAIAISPVLEWSVLNGDDYDVLHSMDCFCTMALAATFHGRSRVFARGTSVEAQRREIEAFATRELAHSLLVGTAHDAEEQARVFARAADFLGLPVELVRLAHGRVPFWRFARELLRSERRLVGFYDATITGIDPFPDREYHSGPDPTLAGIERVFASGINHVLRAEIGIESERRYELLELRRQPRLEARRAGPRLRAAGRRHRRPALRHEHEPRHEGADHPRLLRHGDALLLLGAPGRADEAYAAAAREALHPPFRRWPHVLHLGRFPPSLPRLGTGVLWFAVGVVGEVGWAEGP